MKLTKEETQELEILITRLENADFEDEELVSHALTWLVECLYYKKGQAEAWPISSLKGSKNYFLESFPYEEETMAGRSV